MSGTVEVEISDRYVKKVKFSSPKGSEKDYHNILWAERSFIEGRSLPISAMIIHSTGLKD
jgi:hypothetical protein